MKYMKTTKETLAAELNQAIIKEIEIKAKIALLEEQEKEQAEKVEEPKPS